MENQAAAPIASQRHDARDPSNVIHKDLAYYPPAGWHL